LFFKEQFKKIQNGRQFSAAQYPGCNKIDDHANYYQTGKVNDQVS
jgi:hypothetical protein